MKLDMKLVLPHFAYRFACTGERSGPHLESIELSRLRSLSDCSEWILSRERLDLIWSISFKTCRCDLHSEWLSSSTLSLNSSVSMLQISYTMPSAAGRC